MENQTRGLRNKNPFNIRKSKSRWLGKIKGTDKDFETFDSLEHGYRAGLIILKTYYTKYKLHTIFDIINRFAPSSENDISKYVEFLSDRTFILPREPISLADLLIRVGPQISYYESLFIPEIYISLGKLHILHRQLLKK